MSELEEANARITELEDELLVARGTIANGERIIREQAARIAALTEAMTKQAARVAAANQAKNHAERNAAAIVLELAPGNVNAGEFEVSKETFKKINPDTVLDLHVHSKDCACDQNSGARIAATTSPMTMTGHR